MSALGLGLGFLAGGLSGGPLSPAAVIAPAFLGDVGATRTMAGLYLGTVTAGATLIGGPQLGATVAGLNAPFAAAAVSAAKQARHWRRGILP